MLCVAPATLPAAPAWRRAGCLFLMAMLLVAAQGCSKTTKKAKKAAGGAAAEEKAAPAIDPDTALVVDDGRVSVASPTGWTRAERSKDYLVRYQPGRKKTYPTITVYGEDAPAEFTAITPENHKEFAAALAAGMEATFKQIGPSQLAKKPAAVKLGPHLGVAWAMPAQAKVSGMKETIEQQFYALVVGNRMYKVAAKAPKGKLDADSKAAARAVAGAIGPPAAEPADGAAFGSPAAEAPAAGEAAASTDQPKPASETKPADEPAPAAESKPADDTKPADEATPAAAPPAAEEATSAAE